MLASLQIDILRPELKVMVLVGGAFLLSIHENSYMQVHEILIVYKLQKGEKLKFLYSNNTAGKYYRCY